MGRATAPVRQVEELRDLLHAWLPRLRERYGVQSLGLFGSYVRKQQTAGSDLDVLVEFEKTPGLLTFLKIEHELSDALDLRVDLVMRTSLKLAIAQHVLAEVVPV